VPPAVQNGCENCERVGKQFEVAGYAFCSEEAYPHNTECRRQSTLASSLLLDSSTV
jgi:hypothetical protein